MSDDEDVLLSLEFHDDGFEAHDDVAVGFTAWSCRLDETICVCAERERTAVSVVELVIISSLEIFRICFL